MTYPALEILTPLLSTFAATAVERDRQGGTPKAERDTLRQSGLLALSIPRELGGRGAPWDETLETVRQLARVDSSLAHVFGFHHLLLATAQLFGQPAQWRPWLERTAREALFWGNALNPLDRRTLARRQGDAWQVDGQKSFCSGALDSDLLLLSALEHDDQGRLLIAVVPTGRAGIQLFDDWDNNGQRQTDSGSARFDAVRVENEEWLLEPGPLSTPFACLRPLLAQLIFANIFLGLGEGAFAEAQRYTRNQARPWFKSAAASASEDPYVLRHYGEFWVALESTRLLVERANLGFEQAWRQGTALTAAARGDLAIAIATAKVAASRHGLDLASRLFEVGGARATAGALRLDRYWRNLRTQTLHDPLDYKLHELGDWALNDRLPTPSFYS
ncbi:acyl-CoA dehydrogenase family protein [Pseudomonas oryzihabitans]|uniref:acyl-CoA dehydrogenase family protein n=1 Tax=Pseudomonas oryzihabitans TaxID=47885 RepID=UPI0028944B9D|nr:acyl-CoA dehydrogenase family protein [Pseudomonas oryzihabitans]MDT3721635.1 acyl-CoA dehydrogenase family protein [Pseudomonas oryzihabitans]